MLFENAKKRNGGDVEPTAANCGKWYNFYNSLA